MCLCLLQVPASITTSAQQVQVVPAESAPQAFVAGRALPIVPRGSSALAIQVCLVTGALDHFIACAGMVSALGSLLKEHFVLMLFHLPCSTTVKNKENWQESFATLAEA